MTATAGQPTVFVVDDDAGVRQMISRMARSVGLAVEAYSSVQEFLDLCDPARVGCLVLDVRMPGLSGLDLQDRLLSAQVPLPIIFITGHGDIAMGVRAMKRGAVDFIEKPFHDQMLLDAIHGALAKAVAWRREADERAVARARLATLTRREQQVLALVVAGKLNKQIAVELGTTEQTIKLHRGRLMKKMGAESVPALVVLAQRAGVIVQTPE
ncbi:MAG TPA: response regulator transcription factor [Phycisphaerae bacterium]|nr:response regulator transcription factor [Phycisphaerae bacterium]HNU47093.1 response regulator transcription factor [Phycisphaerae bacterium]